MKQRFRFGLAVLGCRANQAENDAVRSELLALGGFEIELPGPAEVVIINTCAVTGSAQARSRQESRRLIRASSGGAGAVVIVTGCAAQLAPEEFAAIDGVDLVLGNQAKAQLPALLAKMCGPVAGAVDSNDSGLSITGETTVFTATIDAATAAGLTPVVSADQAAAVCWDANPVTEGWLERGRVIPRTRLRPVLKIQDGCPYHCAYCVVATLRGAPRSRPAADVIAEARRLVAAGYRELVLAGINLGLYGAAGDDGRTDGRALASLISELAALEGLRRIRLSSLEPMTIHEALLERIAATPKLAPHFHISFQTGDDEQLLRMKRPYDTDDLRELIDRISALIPHFGLGVDIVAGYPGESEVAFERTLALLLELPVTYIHPFAYSERPGTPGAEVREIVPHRIRKERVRALRELDHKLRLRFASRLAGRACAILIDRVSGTEFSGISGEFVRLGGTASGVKRGDWLEVIAEAPGEGGIQQCRRR